jgi:anti-sigma B factor antagonist
VDDSSCDGDGLMLVVVGDVPRARLLLVGELDLATAPRLARLLGSLLDEGYRQVDLDLTRLTLLAAAGLTVFAEAAAGFLQSGGRLRLVAVPPRSHRILGITGLDTVLDVKASHGGTPRSSRRRTAGATRLVGAHPGR